MYLFYFIAYRNVIVILKQCNEGISIYSVRVVSLLESYLRKQELFPLSPLFLYQCFLLLYNIYFVETI